MKTLKSTAYLILITVLMISCNNSIKNGKKLSQTNIKYLEDIGLIEEKEKIILFTSQMNIQTSGNLITDKRLASYWIDKKKNTREIHSAFYNEIDTLLTKDLTKSMTYASFIKVIKKDKSEFKVYVDDNEKNTNHFFKKALNQWKKKK
ncbi:hypothetical protein [Aquimarina litoralis]|uniref:hypothetical protein n=1 Tax=Aquimarina litoralis TaxID=584605 RepID=UPI001C56C8E4|nr:hypothetical protein [Aquimarina litoralis]MBW1296286.1 hypothetical protein [Aquimarina litoralis]